MKLKKQSDGDCSILPHALTHERAFVRVLRMQNAVICDPFWNFRRV